MLKITSVTYLERSIEGLVIVSRRMVISLLPSFVVSQNKSERDIQFEDCGLVSEDLV